MAVRAAIRLLVGPDHDSDLATWTLQTLALSESMQASILMVTCQAQVTFQSGKTSSYSYALCHTVKCHHTAVQNM